MKETAMAQVITNYAIENANLKLEVEMLRLEKQALEVIKKDMCKEGVENGEYK